MAEKIIIWTIDKCSACERAKQRWPDAEIRSLADLAAGRDPHLDAMTQFNFQDRLAPVVRIGNQFIDVTDLQPQKVYNLHVSRTDDQSKG